MKVLLYAAIDVSKPGGLETHVRELARGLMARGHDVDVFGAPASLPPFRMVQRLEPERYDVVHNHHSRLPKELARHPRSVSTLHFCVAAKMAAYVRLGRRRTLVHPANWRAVAAERATSRRSRRLIAVAERVRQDFRRFHGLSPERATVIPNGVLPSVPAIDRDALRRKHTIAPDAPLLITIGRHDFVKGYDLLARAWRRSGVPARGGVWVIVGGRGAERSDGRVVLGPVAHDEVASWIAAADAGALPSYYEGCSVSLLEMLQGRLYSLAHDVGNAAEVIRNGVNGEIVAPNETSWSEALARTLQQPRRRPSEGLDGSFAWPAIAGRTERVYRDLIEEA